MSTAVHTATLALKREGPRLRAASATARPPGQRQAASSSSRDPGFIIDQGSPTRQPPLTGSRPGISEKPLACAPRGRSSGAGHASYLQYADYPQPPQTSTSGPTTAPYARYNAVRPRVHLHQLQETPTSGQPPKSKQVAQAQEERAEPHRSQLRLLSH